MQPFYRLCLVVSLLGLASCKPRVDDSEVKASSQSENCGGALTATEEAKLSQQAAALARRYFAGNISADEQKQGIDQMLASHKGGGIAEGSAKVAIAMANEQAASAFVLPVLIQSITEPELAPPPGFFDRLAGLGISHGLAGPYLADATALIKPAVKTLLGAGLKYSPGRGWELPASGLSIKKLASDVKLRAAFLQFFSPQVVTDLLDSERSVVLRLDDSMILPPDAAGNLQVMTADAWTLAVKDSLSSLSRETASFISATKKASTYSNMMQGRVLAWFGGERGYKGATAAEIQAAGSYRIMLSQLNRLERTYGVEKSMRVEVIAMLRAANDIEKAQLTAGLAKLEAARKAAIAAPFVPLVIWAAPYAGGLISPAFAASVGQASASMALAPLVFSFGSTAIHTAVDVSVTGSAAGCSFYENFVEQSAGALVKAPFMAAMPAAVSLVAAGGGAVAGSAVVAQTTYGVLNLTMATGSVVLVTQAGIGNLKQCRDLLRQAEEVGRVSGGTDAANALAGQAYKACIEAGFDLTVALVQTGRLTSAAYKAIASKTPVTTEPTFACGKGLSLTEACNLAPSPYGPKEMTEALQNQQNLNEAQQKALQTYGGNAYRAINHQLLTGAKSGPFTTTINEMDGAFKAAPALPKDIILYRGTAGDVPIAAVSETMTLPTFTSTSIDPSVARNFLRPDGVIYEIHMPSEGTAHGLYMPLVPSMPFATEAEVLLPRGSQFKVVSSEQVQVQIGKMVDAVVTKVVLTLVGS